MTKKEIILTTLRCAPNHTARCREFGQYVYHKLASRVSDLRKQGYVIEFIPSDTESPLDASYQLISEPLANIEIKESENHEQSKLSRRSIRGEYER